METYRSDDEWAVLGDRTRRAIVEVLAGGPLAVRELADRLPVSRPAVSQHLKVLRDAGLVDNERRGLWAYYYVIPDALEELSAWLS